MCLHVQLNYELKTEMSKIIDEKGLDNILKELFEVIYKGKRQMWLPFNYFKYCTTCQKDVYSACEIDSICYNMALQQKKDYKIIFDS